jgi:hypothetical protein
MTYRKRCQVGTSLAFLALWGGLTATLWGGTLYGFLVLIDMYWRCARVALLVGVLL